MLSIMFFAWLVAGVTHVTPGLLMIHLRKNCAHVVASISLAHSGSGVFAVRRNSDVRPNGTYTITPIFRCCANGMIISSALRLSIA